VELFLQTNSTVTVQRRFKNQYKCKEAPARNTVKTLVEQFRATGNVTRKKRGGSKPHVRTPNTVGTIRANVASSPTRKSVKQLAAENEVSPSTAWRLFRTDLRMHPYKIHVFQSLTTVCREKRTRFAEEFGDHLQHNPHTLKHIWFTDEAYFHLTGGINRQNVRFWGTKHPHQVHESTLHAHKVLMWCAVSGQGLSRPFMFEDYVTGENYAMRLDSSFLPQLRWRRCSLHAQWFQQDGARPHNIPQVLEFQHSKFQHRIVSNRFPTAIPVPILMATMQSRFKSVWLRPLGLSEGQSVQAVLPELCLSWRRGSRKGVQRSQEEFSPVLYSTLYYVFKRFESPKGLTSSMSSTTLPICEILILVCYFDTVFI
jgi:hypothetical protein